MSTWKTPKGTELPILDLRGKDYLQVQWRLVWFREERPSWSIETSPVEITTTTAFFRAVIKDETGRVVATGHKFEDKAGFADFREKAETGATGRALALVGYGTQFCGDELDEGERLADSPVQKGPGIRAVPLGPNDGNCRPEGTYRIPRHLDARLAGQHPEDADPLVLRDAIDAVELKYKGKIMPAGAVQFIRECEPFVAAWENRVPGA